MKTKMIMAFAVFTAIVFGVSGAFAADAEGTLTVGDAENLATGSAGTEVSLPVSFTVTTAGANVGGAAFTLTYEPDKFEFVKLEQADPQTLSDPDADGYCSSGTCDDPYDTLATSTLFFIANPDNTAGKVMIAAASAEAIANEVLFNAKFKIKDGVAEDTYTDAITVEKSVISNTDAGYSATGDEINVLVGMPDEDYEFTTTLTSGTIKVEVSNPCIKGDADCNGTIDPMDASYVLQYYVGNIGLDSLQGDCDTSGDGAIDPLDASYILQLYVGNITAFP